MFILLFDYNFVNRDDYESCNTVESLHSGHLGIRRTALIIEVSSFQGLYIDVCTYHSLL